MPQSNRYRQLKTRLTELKNHLLPNNFSATGNYTERQQDRARGYRLLVHAEIESYLEDVSRETVTKAIRQWKSNYQPSIVIVSFLASYHSSWSLTSEIDNADLIQAARSRKNLKDSIDEIIDLAQRQFTQKIRNNHGVKDKNIKTLILPTGIDLAALDQTWLTNLDDFGAKRGEVAHKARRVQDGINPKDEYEFVQLLLNGLGELDRKIVALI